jgi:hypothetical protein
MKNIQKAIRANQVQPDLKVIVGLKQRTHANSMSAALQ